MNIERCSHSSPSLGESADFLAENLSELQQKYAGKWVAVAGHTIRLVADDVATLQRMADAQCTGETLLFDYFALPDELLDWK